MHPLKIGMVDVDLLNNGTRFPNLAQMKMSGFCKRKGHDVRLVYTEDDMDNLSDFDILLVSKVFDFTPVPARLQQALDATGMSMEEMNRLRLTEMLNQTSDRQMIHVGGTGFFMDGGQDLQYPVEHSMPDYDLYKEYIESKIAKGRKPSYFSDYIDCSTGFLTRGCFRKCSFCVNRKYDKVFLATDNVFEFHKEGNKVIYLWDDNFLGYGRRCLGLLDKLIEADVPFQFRQGLDIRLMTDEYAERLSQCRYHGDFIFAFDHIQDREIIEEKLKVWREHCTKSTKLYVLCGYDSHCITDPKHYISEGDTMDEKDYIDICNTFERIRILMRHQCLPYITRYHEYEQSRYRGMYVQLARWCNQPGFFKKKSFREFIDVNRGSSNGRCAASDALELFLNDNPSFPTEYLDMKFSDFKAEQD